MCEERKAILPAALNRKGTAMLVAAVVRHAVKEWQDAKALLEKDPSDLGAQETVLDVEMFFAGTWFLELRELAPDVIPVDMMRRLGDDNERIHEQAI